jgi:uncharacterized coiled-coil protein SlyX
MEPLSQSQVHQMLQKFREEYDKKFASQDRTIAEQRLKLTDQQTALTDQQTALTKLSAKVMHVSLSSFHHPVTPTDTCPNSKRIRSMLFIGV